MKKKTKKIIFWCTGIVVILIVLFVIFSSQCNKKSDGPPMVKVTRKNIIDKALAVGSLEPLNEISVKSKISGVVSDLYKDVGDFVKYNEPLLNIKPDPTPLELAEAKRNVQMTEIALKAVKRELQRNEELKQKGLISDHDIDILRRDFEETEIQNKISQERLQLIESGKIKIADTNIETVIKAPITGNILEKSVNIGDPVVPLTSYQAGTELMKMADMKELIFKGTVDEIDVGKISENMVAELQVGALPGQNVKGYVTLISLKARKEENTTVFPIEIIIDETGDAVLRAGFSANANIIIARRDSVLTIPERVVTFRNDSAFVQIPTGEKGTTEIYIQTGLSDAIQIEVISGLEEGQEVLEKKIKEIT